GLRNLKAPAVLDGEIVVLDDAGHSGFELLQNYGRRPEGELAYYVFDILWLDGHDLTGLKLTDRKELLKTLLPKAGLIRYSDHINTKGKQFFKSAQKQKLEGIMAKNGQSQYKTGKRSEQIKTHLRQEAIICGFTEPRGSRKYIGALILGVYEKDRLKYVGHAGGGGNVQLLKDLLQKLKTIETGKSPFSQKIKPNAPVHWVKPKLLVEVSFSEWTADGLMRQPIFKGLRTDKDPKDVTQEKPVDDKNRKVKKASFEYSHLDKIFFKEAGYTKGDLVDYYTQAMPYILPYVTARPQNLLRQPNGYNGKSFYQKDVGDLAPEWVTTDSVYSESNDKNINYYVCDSPDSLLYMVQLGCIEINPWSSTVKKLDRPDWIVLDLDPEDISFKKVVEVALAAKEFLDELKIPALPKTSGKTGIHIYMPTKADYTYDQAKKFGEILAHLVHARLPGITSLERSPAKRQKRVYLDYLQNRESQTLAAPYSVRPTKFASVSTPLHWNEVNDKLDPTKFTIKNTFKRLEKEGDLWKSIFKQKVNISRVLKQYLP
ncbi:DNA ligase D, partial [Candidatus Saccharibacteria bacterium]|nr:DNA ligase D [Candidatus Saccharibacteria bacterium]